MHARAAIPKRYLSVTRLVLPELKYDSQLRCTRELDGCRRCLSRNLQCEYERDSHRRSRRSNESVNHRITDYPTSIITSDDGHIGSAAFCAQFDGPAVARLTEPVTPATISRPSTSADSNSVFDFLNDNLEPVNGFLTSDVIPTSSTSGSFNDYGLSPGIITAHQPREGGY